MAPRILLGLVLVAVVTFGGVMPSQACTSLRVKSTEGHVFYARTMEFSTSDQPQVAVMPKGTVMRGTLPDGRQEGATWTSKYGFVGMRDYGPPLVSDGMNEKGLVVGMLFFPGMPGISPMIQPFQPRPLPILKWPTGCFPVSPR